MEFPIDELKQFQNKLREATQEEAEEILDSLKSASITFAQLKETKIGKTVRRVEKNFPSLRVKTKALIEKWKALLPQKSAPKAPIRLGEKQECCIATLTKVLGDKELAERIEAAMSSSLDQVKYDQKTRALRANLQKNVTLRNQVQNGEITPEALIQMGPREMATAESKMQREQIEKDLTDSRRSDWLVANTKMEGSMYKCLKCKSAKTITSQLQTRSADEPMTT